jgi:hypothetical protein
MYVLLTEPVYSVLTVPKCAQLCHGCACMEVLLFPAAYNSSRMMLQDAVVRLGWLTR